MIGTRRNTSRVTAAAGAAEELSIVRRQDAFGINVYGVRILLVEPGLINTPPSWPR